MQEIKVRVTRVFTIYRKRENVSIFHVVILNFSNCIIFIEVTHINVIFPANSQKFVITESKENTTS